jgi:hypothetical protein
VPLEADDYAAEGKYLGDLDATHPARAMVRARDPKSLAVTVTNGRRANQ